MKSNQAPSQTQAKGHPSASGAAEAALGGLVEGIAALLAKASRVEVLENALVWMQHHTVHPPGGLPLHVALALATAHPTSYWPVSLSEEKQLDHLRNHWKDLLTVCSDCGYRYDDPDEGCDGCATTSAASFDGADPFTEEGNQA